MLRKPRMHKDLAMDGKDDQDIPAVQRMAKCDEDI
jgi:hypothetical protein